MPADKANVGPTFSEVIVEALQRFGPREAFVLGDRRITYSETAVLVSRIQQVLQSMGIGRFGAVAALSPNMPEVWMCQAATYLLGGHYSGLHPMGSVDDHVFLCGDAEISVLIVHPTFAEAGAAIVERSPSIQFVLTLGPSDLGQDLFKLLDKISPRTLNAGPAEHEDVAWLQYTGGTTGRAKGVMLSQRAMAQEVQSAMSWQLPLTPRYLAAAPITHAGVLPLLPTLVRGGTVVLQDRFDPEKYLHAVENERINYGFLVPTMLYVLLDHGVARDYDLSSLETIVYGAAPSSPTRIAEALDTFGPILLHAYGQTECIGMATYLAKDEHDPDNHPERLASCGRQVQGVRVELIGDDGQMVAQGEVGEVCVRSAVTMSGYWKLPELSADALRNGWLHTGDLAMRDDAGYFYIVDRKKDMIISGGMNIYPREIEDVICEDLGVSAVAVIGIPDAKWGEAVTAFVVARPGSVLDVDSIRSRVRARKGPHQTPKHVEIVEELPLTAVGKIDKKVLRAPFWLESQRRVN